MGKRIVIALGGNALGTTLPEQASAVKITARAIVDLIEDGNQVIIAHGNGPQVGIINNAMLALMHEDHSQGATPPVGVRRHEPGLHRLRSPERFAGGDVQPRHHQQARGDHGHQVEVDPNDPAFQNPTKPIGKFLTEEEAKEMAEKTGFLYKEDSGRGWRRYVASREPKHIIEAGRHPCSEQRRPHRHLLRRRRHPRVRTEGNHLKGAAAVIARTCSSLRSSWPRCSTPIP